MKENLEITILLFNFASKITSEGALAHLARAFDWQSRGGRFESDMLHKASNLHSKLEAFFNCRYEMNKSQVKKSRNLCGEISALFIF